MRLFATDYTMCRLPTFGLWGNSLLMIHWHLPEIVGNYPMAGLLVMCIVKLAKEAQADTFPPKRKSR